MSNNNFKNLANIGDELLEALKKWFTSRLWKGMEEKEQDVIFEDRNFLGSYNYSTLTGT